MTFILDIIIGIDGGGTNTRVAIADLYGNVLSYANSGGAHPEKNKTPKLNIEDAINSALNQLPDQHYIIQSMVAGIAGINKPSDKEWAINFFSNYHPINPLILINDGEIAQFGAFLGSYGILAIAGTGSNVLGKTEEGLIVPIRNFNYDPQAGARYLSHTVLLEMISTQPYKINQEFLTDIFHYWNVNSIDHLRILASHGFGASPYNANQKLSEMAPLVTRYARLKDPIALYACQKISRSLVTSIHSIASIFSSSIVPVSFVGSVINDPIIKTMVIKMLNYKKSIKTIVYQTPHLSPVYGALLLGYHQLGIDWNAFVKNNNFNIVKK